MLSGVFTPMVTGFDGEGRVDVEGNRRIVEHVIGGGVDGILFLGSIGEFFAMTVEERKQFARFAVEAVAGRAAVLVGTGGTVVEEVVELTRDAAECGADAAVVIPPYYFALDEESLYRYYAAVATCSELPILLYNFPDRTGANMSPELVARLARDFPTIVGLKDTVDTISHTRAVIGRVKPERPDFAILSGFDEYLVGNLLAGGDGLIGGMSNIAPSLLTGIRDAFAAGDLAGVAAGQRRLSVLMGLYGLSEPFVAAIKGAVSMVVPGVCPACRPPTGELTDEQRAAIRETLLVAGVLT